MRTDIKRFSVSALFHAAILWLFSRANLVGEILLWGFWSLIFDYLSIHGVVR